MNWLIVAVVLKSLLEVQELYVRPEMLAAPHKGAWLFWVARITWSDQSSVTAQNCTCLYLRRIKSFFSWSNQYGSLFFHMTIPPMITSIPAKCPTTRIRIFLAPPSKKRGRLKSPPRCGYYTEGLTRIGVVQAASVVISGVSLTKNQKRPS